VTTFRRLWQGRKGS